MSAGAIIGPIAVLASLVPGLLIGDCVLIALAAVLTVFAFDLMMERAAPQDGWRVAIRCGFTGIALIVAGIAVTALALFRLIWASGHVELSGSAMPSLLIALAVSAGMVASLKSGSVLRWWAVAAIGALFAQWAVYNGLSLAECVFAGLSGLAVLFAGARLAGPVVGALLWAGRR